MLDNASSFDAVLIATPDHWHAPLCKAFMKAGKHVYCEKPLTHSVAEARELRELSRTCKVVTQMGNQGSASASLRRCTEIIKAGALGQIREIYQWGIGVTANEGSAEGEDPIPAGFNWDLWVGPSAMRPFKKDVYHPFRWRGWFDFGNGGLADFCCHAINLPMRALDLGYPEKIVVNMQDGKQIADKAAVEFHFPARGNLAPLTLHWQGNGKPPAEVLQPLVDVYKDKLPDGLMIVGEKGCIYTSHWNTGGLIRLQGEPRLKDVLHHDATKDIPQTLPRTDGPRPGMDRRLPRPGQDLLRLRHRRQAHRDRPGGRRRRPHRQEPGLGRREDGGHQRPRGRPVRSHRIPNEVADLSRIQDCLTIRSFLSLARQDAQSGRTWSSRPRAEPRGTVSVCLPAGRSAARVSPVNKSRTCDRAGKVKPS